MSHNASHLLMTFQGTKKESRENRTPLGDNKSRPTLSGTAAKSADERKRKDMEADSQNQRLPELEKL